jgi:hypothetical protein
VAKNTGEGYRRGEVRDRSQFQAPNGNWVKRDDETGRIMDQKTDGKPFITAVSIRLAPTH